MAEQIRAMQDVCWSKNCCALDLPWLIAEGRVSPPKRSGLPGPLDLTGDPQALSQALDDIRGDH